MSTTYTTLTLSRQCSIIEFPNKIWFYRGFCSAPLLKLLYLRIECRAYSICVASDATKKKKGRPRLKHREKFKVGERNALYCCSAILTTCSKYVVYTVAVPSAAIRQCLQFLCYPSHAQRHWSILWSQETRGLLSSAFCLFSITDPCLLSVIINFLCLCFLYVELEFFLEQITLNSPSSMHIKSRSVVS